MSIREHDFTIERRFRQSPQQTFQAFGLFHDEVLNLRNKDELADPELRADASLSPVDVGPEGLLDVDRLFRQQML